MRLKAATFVVVKELVIGLGGVVGVDLNPLGADIDHNVGDAAGRRVDGDQTDGLAIDLDLDGLELAEIHGLAPRVAAPG